MEMSAESETIVAMIKACGYRVFMRPPFREYCFYTDGTRIGYAQWSGIRTCTSSVHKANRITGTGYHVADAVTPETLAAAITCYMPAWADGRDASSVKKYADWAAFHKESSFNSELVEV